jgi:hypothetical protein
MARTKMVSLIDELPVPGKGEGVVGKVDVHHLGQHLTGVGTGDVDHAHGVGQVDQVKIPTVETGVVADPFHGLPGPAGGGGEIVVVFTQLDHDAVVDDAAVVVAHGRVLDAAFLDLAHIRHVHPLQRFERIGSVDTELAQGGSVQHAHVVAHIEDLFLAVNILGEVTGPLPDADVAERCRHPLSGSHAGGCA